MKSILNLGFSLVLWLTFSLSYAQQLSSEKVADLDQLLSKYGENTPGISVLITKSGEVIYERYLGLADMEHGIPVSSETVFEAGSVSKQFTATAILMLVQEGKISLDDEIQKYLPEVPVYERPITIRHLVQHTSGLKDWGSLAGLGGWDRGTRVYTNDIALNYIVRQPDLNYSPGDEYLYSNSNYTLMTHIVERVSGQKLAEFTLNKMFKPFGMNKTSWRTDYRQVVPYRAIGYEIQGSNYLMSMPFENTYGHAALLTTVHDLNRWNTSWYQGNPDVALRELREEAGVLTNGNTILYAGGVMIGDHNGQKVVHHSGATAGYRAWLAYFPAEALSIVFLSNDANAKTAAIGEGMADIVLGPKVKNTVASNPDARQRNFVLAKEQVKAFEGTYVCDAVDGKWKVSSENGQLFVQIYPHSQKQKMTPVSENHFAVLGLGALHFIKKSGQFHTLKVTVGRARNVTFTKIK